MKIFLIKIKDKRKKKSLIKMKMAYLWIDFEWIKKVKNSILNHKKDENNILK